VGDVINDILVEADGGIVAGEDNTASVRVRPGGSAANQAAWMGYRGIDVVFAGRVGRLDADFHRLELARFGVSARLAVDEALGTGSIVVLVEGDGERTMITDRSANLRLVAADVPFALLDGAALLHLTGYTFFDAGLRGVALGLIAEARDRGIPFTVDPGSAAFLARLPAGDFLRWTEGAAVCFPNRDEAAVLTGQPGSASLFGDPGLVKAGGGDVSGHETEASHASEADPATMAASLARRYGMVALKLGPDGALLAKDGSSPRRFPAVAASARDATGAGDAFCAGFLAAWLGGAGPSSATVAASRVAAAAVAIRGGRPPASARPR
jgi:sugar/nucleoside kinase (ribokinase family)